MHSCRELEDNYVGQSQSYFSHTRGNERNAKQIKGGQARGEQCLERNGIHSHVINGAVSYFSFDRWMSDADDDADADGRRLVSSSSSPSSHYAGWVRRQLVLAVCGVDANGSLSSVSSRTRSNVQLDAWNRGPGWRVCFNNPIESGHPYYVFEPDWIRVTQCGVAITKQLYACIAVEADKWHHTAHTVKVHDEKECSNSSSSTCGSGDAADLPHTAAVESVDEAQQLNASTESEYELAPSDFEMPSFAPLREWPIRDLTSLLHALQRVAIVSTHLDRCQVGVSIMMTEAKHRRPYEPFTHPLPIVLPWSRLKAPSPADILARQGKEEDDNSNAQPRFNNRRLLDKAIYEIWQEELDDPFIDIDGIDAPLSSDSSLSVDSTASASASLLPRTESTSCAYLSGSLRGCPWPAACTLDDHGGPIAHEAERSIVSRRIAALINSWPGLRDCITDHAWVPLKREIEGGTWESLESNFFLRSPQQSQTSADSLSTALSPLRDLLPSSLVVTVGSEHLIPFPAYLVAPQSPGWIGGFMGGATTRG